jgi:hypothetical protein
MYAANVIGPTERIRSINLRRRGEEGAAAVALAVVVALGEFDFFGASKEINPAGDCA